MADMMQDIPERIEEIPLLGASFEPEGELDLDGQSVAQVATEGESEDIEEE